ncbi:DNA-dependent protein kinase catalytic subunit-like [Euwallacea fornicatus]|uniref:DNA-dependent protein kinase catalytic subunit-like n=1 Tax=Euwallacea fornicatus TaxID=995702 RepID=UPI00338E2D2B
MDIEPQNFFHILREHSRDSINGSAECHRLLTILNYNLTEEQLNTTIIDLYILYIFDKSNGLLSFVLENISTPKFDHSCVKSLEIVYTLISNFSHHIEEYILDINEKCLKLLQSKASARIKTKVLDVLIISFEKVDRSLDFQLEYTQIFEGIRACLISGIHSDSIRQKEFSVIGLFSKKFQYLVIEPNDLKKLFISELDRTMVRGPSQHILHGVFTGLKYFCESFNLSCNNSEDAVILDKLYKHIDKLSKSQADQRFGNRAALEFFSCYMNFFENTLITTYKVWHKKLLRGWMAMKGFEDRKVGEETLRSLLFTIANALRDLDKTQGMPILDHFIKWFKSILWNVNAPHTEKKLCIQGLNYFSGVLYQYYCKEDARNIFLLLTQSFDKFYILGDNSDNEEWAFLPDYIQCLAGFVRYQTFSNAEVICLQRAVINMFKTFDKLKSLHHSLVIESLVTTFFYLKMTNHFHLFVENVVYQGVIWSCSHQHISDSELIEENEKIVTVKNYFPLWRGLLKLVPNRCFDRIAIYLEDRQYILTKVVNELVKTLMILVDKLNVNVELKIDEVQNDLNNACKVKNRNDFNIFLNVTDFYEEILTSIDADMLKDYICKMVNHMVGKCLKHPLVSGFYKLLACGLKISNSLRLFEEGNLTLNQDMVNCKETLSKFLTYLLHKMKQFKDELLISCLKVLLESPVVVVKPLLPDCVGIFITIFEVGRSYLPLATIGLTTLENWQQCMDKTEFEQFLLQVVPSLDSYLRSKSLGGLTQVATIEKKRKASQILKKRTVLVELEPELVKFQKKVLRFVGSQNSRVCHAFACPDNNFERKVTSDNLHLKLPLPYEDLSLEIYLEPFIMRVVDLSLYSSDRKTRVMACEVLQAFVLVFLGRIKLIPPSSLVDLEDLLKNIAMPLLQLASDIDQIVGNIFQPLFMQLIHWYTSRMQRESSHLAVIIDVLMDGVTHPTNSSLRDFSGKCVREFVKWTIKQSSDDELRNRPRNIKVLVKKMRFFSSHPDLVKKRGAALIFNNIYKEFREERALISIFAIELVHIFINSLVLLGVANEEVENTFIHIRNAISHLERILIEKRDIFRTSDNLRRIPSDIPSGGFEGLSKWLLDMTANTSKYCRTVCIDLFVAIEPITRSLSGSLTKNIEEDLISHYLKPLSSYPTLDNFDSKGDATALLLKWLQGLLCQLDGFNFVIMHFQKSIDFTDQNNIISISYFLENLQDVTIDQGLKLMSTNSSLPYYYTLENKEQFQLLKSCCCRGILKLSVSLLNSDQNIAHRGFWTELFLSIILKSLFNPSSLGFEDKLGENEHSQILVSFLDNMSKKLSEKYVLKLVDLLTAYVSDSFCVEIDLKHDVSLKQRYLLKGLVTIQSTKLNTRFQAENFSKGLIDKLMNSFLSCQKNNIVFISRLSELTFEHCSLILKFSLSNTEELSSFLSHFYKNLTVNCPEFPDNDMTFGMYLLTKFSDPLVEVILNNFHTFLVYSDSVEVTVKTTTYVLKYLDDNKEQFKDKFVMAANSVLGKWSLFQMHFEKNNVDCGLDFVRQFWKLFAQNIRNINTEDVQKWLIDLICRENILLSETSSVTFYFNVFEVLAEVVEDDIEGLDTAVKKFETMLSSDLSNSSTIDKLLAILPAVKSHTVFKFLIKFYVNHSQLDKNDIDLSYLLKVFMTKSPEDTQSKILSTLYHLALNETESFEKKKKMADTVLPNIFKNCEYVIFEKFFADNIRDISTCLESLNNYGDGLIYFSLLEILFLRIPIESEERLHCSITVASGNPKLRALLLKLALNSFRNSPNIENKEELRVYKCFAYKTLASIISNSIRTKNFYEKLFIRKENDKDILWSALIDTSSIYAFDVDFDSYPKKRKILVNIRDDLRQQMDTNKSKSLRYIESQRLFNSSLSEDITKFDFTTSILRSHGRNDENVDREEEKEGVSNTTFLQRLVFLESTEVNNHELMATVCGVIEHMFSNRICHLPYDPEEMVEFPSWMSGIVQLLLDSNTHPNIKIFWIKVIDNMIHIFRHFAKYFVEPLLQFLNNKVAGNSLNYFVSDVIVILATWSKDVQPNEKEANLASNFLEHVVKILTNDRQDSFKYNLDLVKLLVENWKDFVQVPYDTLFSKLNCDINSRPIEVGIHLISIFLANSVLPCDNSKIDSFWNVLVNILSSDVLTIYKPCAETIGLMLRYFKQNEMTQESFSLGLKKVLLSFHDINKYAKCLEGVAMHYPDIVDQYHLEKILSRLPQSDMNLQSVFLKIICKKADILNDNASFKGEDWTKFLESQSATVQLITLEIILKTIGILTHEITFKEILKSVCKNTLNPNSFCRGRMYDIMIAVLEAKLVSCDVLEQCQEVLVYGLTERDIELRNKVRTFWSKNPAVPLEISKKFPYLLSNFYLAKTEDQFLGYASYFLLESIKPDEYNKELFEHPLEDCEFQEYKLQTNWRLQHPSVVPMFAETLSSYSEGLDETIDNLGAIRATQDNLSFAQTQQVNAREVHISQVTSLESSLFGSIGDASTFLNPNEIQLSHRYKLNKRRFLRDKAKVSKNYAHLAVAQKQQQVFQRYDAAKEREKKVTIYRSYRNGDFPDIQITLGSLIKPLQMLILNDSELAKTFFTVLYKTLNSKLSDINEIFFSEVLNGIKRIFTTTVQYNTNVFSTLFDILLDSKKKFRVDPAIIAAVCQQSGLASVGTLVIEEYIMELEPAPSSSKKRSGVGDDETKHWLKLAELYRELNEWNLVRTIFMEKSNCKEDVHEAVILESQKRWRDAQEKYQSLIQTDVSPERQDFYYESYFKCLAHLGEWEKLPKAVENLVPEEGEKTWDSLWDNNWFQQKILPWYISAQVKNLLFSKTRNNQFFEDINKSLSREDQAQYLKNNFSEEFCILWLTRERSNQAMQYLKAGLENFLSEWQLLNPMFGSLRYDKVLNLRTLIEIERFLLTEKCLTEVTGKSKLSSLQDYWRSTQSESLTSLILNESKLLYRKQFLKILIGRLESNADLVKELKKTEIMLDISFMKLAVDDGNYYMVKKYYKSYATMKHASLTMIYGSLGCLYTKLIKNKPELQLKTLLNSLTKFKSVVNTTKGDKAIASLLKIMDISEEITDILNNNPDLCSKYKTDLTETFGSDCTPSMQIACDDLKREIFKMDLDNTTQEVIKEQAKALVKLAYFVQEKSDQEKNFVVFVLRAMRLGSKEARQLFPCILLKNSVEEEAHQDFIAETQYIPCWMFLGWIPQLLANVDTRKVTAISDIILRIAKTYPQAIMYSYRLSKENYSQTHSEFSEETKLLTNELDALLLHDVLVDQFLSALCKVSVPLTTLQYYIKKMSACQKIEDALNLRNEIMEFFFKDTPASYDSKSMQGNIYRQVKDFKAAFEGVTELSSMQEIKNILVNPIAQKCKALLDKKHEFSKELKDYCPWLANFSAARLNIELEIPGQYSGDKLPLIQHHVKLSGFHREVSVMTSLRKPIKLTMLGMDSKEYPFLVKFGEDTRQDQRVQQLFMLMNSIFANDNKSHYVLIYQVIPLTSSLGMIQWVDHTVSLQSFIERSLPNKRTNMINHLGSKFQKFLGKTGNDLEGYGLMAQRKDRNKVIPFFQSLVNMIPRDVLRTSIWSLSLSTESFIAFRDNFIKSYAVICICHWILGIGDRHLQNFLVCTRNGKVLGIDFGHAFGTATQILPIPELVPIRLTPHIVALMEPLKEKGALRDVMIDCLKSLRVNVGPLLATMNVFAQEPSVDWLEHAKRFHAVDQSSDHVWYPLQKVEQAARKLQGASSAAILIEDLKFSIFNLLKPEFFKAFMTLVEGSPIYDLRARLKTENLSVEDQVDSLIDHATDENLLGRMYLGWAASV